MTHIHFHTQESLETNSETIKHKQKIAKTRKMPPTKHYETKIYKNIIEIILWHVSTAVPGACP